ncbi:MAG: response regulator [Lentisphaerales bacterium]|nr:response regulator [Lentisphaerales bacterium]
MKAIVIEEENETRDFLCEQLFELGVESVLEFNSGRKAVQYIENHNADRLTCIFLNINIKSFRASSFLDELMLHSIYQDIPVFIITDNEVTIALLEDLNHEVCAYLTKPLTKKQIRECVSISRRIERVNILLETQAG